MPFNPSTATLVDEEKPSGFDPSTAKLFEPGNEPYKVNMADVGVSGGEFADVSPVKLPLFGQPGTVTRGASKALSGLVEGATTPEGVALGAGLMVPVVGPALGVAMGAGAVKQAAQLAGEAFVTKDPETIGQAAALGLAGTAGVVGGSLGIGLRERVPLPETIKEAAKPIGPKPGAYKTPTGKVTIERSDVPVEPPSRVPTKEAIRVESEVKPFTPLTEAEQAELKADLAAETGEEPTPAAEAAKPTAPVPLPNIGDTITYQEGWPNPRTVTAKVVELRKNPVPGGEPLVPMVEREGGRIWPAVEWFESGQVVQPTAKPSPAPAAPEPTPAPPAKVEAGGAVPAIAKQSLQSYNPKPHELIPAELQTPEEYTAQEIQKLATRPLGNLDERSPGSISFDISDWTNASKREAQGIPNVFAYTPSGTDKFIVEFPAGTRPSMAISSLVDAIKQGDGPGTNWLPTAQEDAIKSAIQRGDPILATSLDQHGIHLPRGYIKAGNVYRRVDRKATGERPSKSESETGIKTLENTGPGIVGLGGATSGPGISNGPGAATYGTPGTYKAISALSDQMETTPVKNLREAVSTGERLSDVWAEGKDTITRALGKLRVVPAALKRTWQGVREFNEVENKVKDLDWSLQQSAGQSKQAGEAMQRAIPASQMRDAMAIWIDAGGNEAAIRDTLAKLPAGTKPKVRRALESALNLPDEVKTNASNLADYYARRAQEGQSEGVLENVLEDYFTHIWKKPANMPDSVKGALNSGRVNEYFQYSRQRKIPTFLEGILQGKEPVLDPSQVIPNYNYLMDRAIASRRFIKSLEDAKMPDGKPVLGPWGTRSVVGDPGEGVVLIKIRGRPEDYNQYRQIDHPALRKWKWAATDEEGRPVFYEGTLAVHPEAFERLARMMDRSRLTPSKITRALLRVSGEVKGAKLGLLSPFHQVHLGSHALGHWTNPFTNLPKIDWEAPNTRFAVEKGGLKLAPNPAEMAQFAEGILGPGLVQKIPGIGPISKAYSEWLFTDYVPRLKLKTFENAWARNQKLYGKDLASGKITPEQLAQRTGDAINNAYGEQNQLWLGKHGRDPRTQRALRLGFLAPDFGESRLRFIGKAFKPYGAEERIALGTLFATLYAGARIGNILTHGDPEIADWKHAFAVKEGNRWYSMRSVLGDTLHAFANFPNFLYVRLNPAYARGVMEFFTGRDITGRKRTAGQQVLDELKQIVPIHLSGLTRDDQHVWESFLQAIGLGSQRAAPTAQVSQLARDWKTRRGVEDKSEMLSDPNSPYRKARLALEFGKREDFRAATRELIHQRQLRGDRTPRATVQKAFERYYTQPFTGSSRMEPAFKASLGPREAKKYSDALLERRKLLQKFRSWY